MKKKNERHIAILLAVMMIFMNFIITPVMAAPGDVAINEATFPDANFLAYVQTLDGDHDGKLSPAEIANVKVIDVTSKNIASLSGIKYFTALQTLHCGNNQLSTLDMSKNTALQSLYCYSNKLTNLDISQNLALQTLDCSSNQLTSLDISNNPSLKILYCQYNQLTSLDISNNPSLIALYCQYNQLTSLDLSNNLALAVLWCNRNQLTNLNVSNNPALRELYCYNNQLTNLDVSKNTALQELKCNDNELTKMDVSNNTKLETLYCGRNQLTILDLSKNINLKALYCGVNQLTTLDLSKNINLKTLDCGMNQLTNLDLSSNTALVAFAGLNQKYNIQVNASTLKFDLRSLPGKFNPSNASGWVGGDVDTVDSNILKLKNDPKPTEVKYNYKVNNDDKNINVTLKVKYGNFVTVTFNKNGKGGDPATIVKTIDKGSTVEKPSDDPTDEQFDFDGWYTEAACINPFDFTKAVNDNITLYAKWTAKTPPAVETVTITFNANGHGTAPEAITVNKGTVATAPTDPTDADNDFGGWFKEAACTNKFDFTQAVNASITLYAKWTAKTPPPPEQVTLTTNIINGGGTVTVTPNTATVDKGKTIVVTFNPETNYEIGTVTLDGTNVKAQVVSNRLTITMDKSKTLWVTFKEKPVAPPPTVASIAVKSTEHKTEYKVGDPLDLTNLKIEATMSDGTKLIVPVTAGMVTDFDTSAPATNKPVTITYGGKTTTFKINVTASSTPPTQYTLTASVNGGHGTVDPTTATKNKNETVTLTFAPDTGYEIEEVKVNDVATPVSGNTLTLTMDGDKTVVVKYKATPTPPPTPVTYTLTASVDGGHGSVTSTNATKNKNETVTLTFAPDAGYELDTVTVNGTAVGVMSNVLDITMNENKTVVVKFKAIVTPPPTPVTYNLTASVDGGHGTVDPTNVTKNNGDTVTLTFAPDAGYELDIVTVNGTTVGVMGNVLDITMNENKTVIVKFKAIGTPPTPPTPPTPEPDPYYPGYYDDWYEPYRPHRPYRPYRNEEPEEKPIDKPAKKVETDVILVIGSNNLDTRINGVDSFKGMDVAPYIKNGRTMLPIRYIAEALGMSVSWDAKTRTVIIQDMFYTVEIPVDTNIIKVNGEVFTSDVKPEIVHGRTMMPIANIARALGLKDGKDIFWDGTTRKATIIRKITK